jgi:hypothetical protein
MILKRRVMDPRVLDEMSEALAFNVPTDALDGQGHRILYRFVPQYVFNHYPKGLRERCYGPHSRALVGVTRFYPRCEPPVVVDFEPPPPDPWFRDEKLQFFLERGIAYVPITLRDVLTTEAFIERVHAAQRMATAGKAETDELRVLASVGRDVEQWLQEPDVVASLDRETLEVLADENVRKRRGRPLTGVARLARLATIKTQLVKQLREDMRCGRVVDPLKRHHEPASATE